MRIACAIVAACLVASCGDKRAEIDIVSLVEVGDESACDAALPLLADQARRVELPYTGNPNFAAELAQRTSISARDPRKESFNLSSGLLKCSAVFDVRWKDGRAPQVSSPPMEGAREAFGLRVQDGKLVTFWDQIESGDNWHHPPARARYARMGEELAAEEALASQPTSTSNFVPDEPIDEDIDAADDMTNPSYLQDPVMDAEKIRLVGGLSEQWVEAALEGSLQRALAPGESFDLRRPALGSPLRLDATVGLKSPSQMSVEMKLTNVGTSVLTGRYRVTCQTAARNGSVLTNSVVIATEIAPRQSVYLPIYFTGAAGPDASCIAPELLE